jgi:hypothetical protein
VRGSRRKKTNEEEVKKKRNLLLYLTLRNVVGMIKLYGILEEMLVSIIRCKYGKSSSPV